MGVAFLAALQIRRDRRAEWLPVLPAIDRGRLAGRGRRRCDSRGARSGLGQALSSDQIVQVAVVDEIELAGGRFLLGLEAVPDRVADLGGDRVGRLAGLFAAGLA